MEGFGTPSIGDTPMSLSCCGEGGLQVTLGGPVGYHSETSKEVISIGIYLEGRHESVHVIVGNFLSDDICMRLANLGPIWVLVGKVEELLAFEALDLAKFPRFPVPIFGVRFASGLDVVIILCEDDSARGCA